MSIQSWRFFECSLWRGFRTRTRLYSFSHIDIATFQLADEMPPSNIFDTLHHSVKNMPSKAYCIKIRTVESKRAFTYTHTLPHTNKYAPQIYFSKFSHFLYMYVMYNVIKIIQHRNVEIFVGK